MSKTKLTEKELTKLFELIKNNPISMELFMRLAELFKCNKELDESKNQAYWERNQLIVLLTKIYPSYITAHPQEDKEWDKEWRWIVCIDFPNSQGYWHIHDSEFHYFKHLTQKDNTWGGHSTEEKYERIAKIEKQW